MSTEPTCRVFIGPDRSTGFAIDRCKVESTDFNNEVHVGLRGEDGAALLRVSREKWDNVIMPAIREYEARKPAGKG